MRTLRIPIATALLQAFVVGCDEQMGPTTSSRELAAPAFNFTNGPASPGPNIIRTEVEFAVFYFDEDRGVSAIHGTDIVQFCQGNVAFELVDLQEINVPADADRFIDLMQGDDLTTSVWPFTTFDCNLFLTTPPLATGVVDLVNTDNDLLVFLRDNRNSNAFGWTAHGQLTRPSGQRAHFNGVMKTVWDGVDGLRKFKVTDVINLK